MNNLNSQNLLKNKIYTILYLCFEKNLKNIYHLQTKNFTHFPNPIKQKQIGFLPPSSKYPYFNLQYIPKNKNLLHKELFSNKDINFTSLVLILKIISKY